MCECGCINIVVVTEKPEGIKDGIKYIGCFNPTYIICEDCRIVLPIGRITQIEKITKLGFD